jgi:hypothetical protein
MNAIEDRDHELLDNLVLQRSVSQPFLPPEDLIVADHWSPDFVKDHLIN